MRLYYIKAEFKLSVLRQTDVLETEGCSLTKGYICEGDNTILNMNAP